MSTIANVTIVSKAWSDLRFVTLARLLGLKQAPDALIRCARLWAHQTATFTYEEPTYAVSADFIESAIGIENAAASLVRAQLAVEQPNTLGETVYRIRGTEGRIEWAARNRENAPLGAAQAKRNREYLSRPHGVPGGYPDGLNAPIGMDSNKLSPTGHPAGTPTGTPGGTPTGGPSSLFSPRSDLSVDPDPPDLSDRSPASPVKTTRKKPERNLPDDWIPRPQDRDRRLTEPQLASELPQFRNHAIQKDRKCADWNAAWRNWQIKAVERTQRAGPNRGAIGSATPRTDHPEAKTLKHARDVL